MKLLGALGIGMTIQVRISGHLQVFNLTGAGASVILHSWVQPTSNLNRIEFVCGFYFTPTD
jgi:hypothetical protein